MPSNMQPIVDPAITRGMNTVDDPKLLKPGECVRLLNAFPGNPPRPRNGCTGLLISGTVGARFFPPGIAFTYGGVVYVVTWIFDGVNTTYDISTINSATGALNDSGSAEFAVSTNVLFDLLELHSCIYSAVSHVMTTWRASNYGAGGNHKVIEGPLMTRDLCISQAGIIASHALTLAGGTLNPGKWVEYAFQYVRRNDAAAFEAGGTPTNIRLPPNITTGYKPKRIDTFLPGSCIGIEAIANRHTVEITETACTPTVSTDITTGVGAEQIGSFSAANCIDGNPSSGVAFDVDTTAAGAWIKIDYGAGVTRCLTKLDIYTSGVGSTNNFKLQYSADGTTWVDGSVSTVLALAGWNTIIGTALTAHRYWRLYLVDAGTGTIDFMQLRAYGKSGVTFTMWTDSYTAYLEGATHLRVSRSLEQTTEALAQGATKFFLMDLPILESASPTFDDVTSNAALEGEENQLITGYSVAPPAAFIEYLKGRLYLMALDGKVYFSESVGGDGGTVLATAQAYPQAWASLYKPTEYLLDCDYVDGQQATGMKRLGDDIFFFKERKIFAIFGGDPTTTSLSQVSNTIGCAFPYTLTKCEIKGMFGKCLLFLGSTGPMVMEEGGRVRPFSEFKIKQLWPDSDTELYSELDTDYDWIIHNCTAAFFKDTWWVMYQTKAGTSRIFGYYFDPDLGTGNDAPHGPLEFQFASM